MQDQFMKLLVAQLNNQDPMNPMDNAQMTSQIAQINTVSGINQLNDTVKSLSTQFTSMQTMQGTAMIGHDVLLNSSTLSVNAGVAKGAVDLPSDASAVSVQIISPGGQLVDTVNLGPLAAGRHAFQWDASKYTGGGSPTFKVVATNGGQSVTATGLAQDTVTSVGTNGTAMSLQLKGRAAVTYDAIQAVL
jgi:flagellar basal-body rod modification protein FlgD